MKRLYSILAMLLPFVLGITQPVMTGGEPVIAVAAAGETAEAQVSAQAASCPWFLLYDGQGSLVEAVANPHQQAAGGAGPEVVEFLAAKGIQTVNAGEFGPKMANALKSKGMTFRVSAGTAACGANRCQSVMFHAALRIYDGARPKETVPRTFSPRPRCLPGTRGSKPCPVSFYNRIPGRRNRCCAILSHY